MDGPAGRGDPETDMRPCTKENIQEVVSFSIYSQIKDKISTRDAAERYGFEVDKYGKILCPFHDDHDPSMKIDRNFFCFGCGAKGDVITFTSLLFHLSPYEAAKKLAQDFGIEAGPLPPVQGVKKKRSAGRNEIEKAAEHAASVYRKGLRLLDQWRVQYAPKITDEEYDPRFVEALTKSGFMEYLCETLETGTLKDKADILLDKGKEVRKLERRYAELTARDKKRPERRNKRNGSRHDRRRSV